MTIVVDVTQFSRQPARSGVQRALGEMARAWPHEAEAVFAARLQDGMWALPPDRFAELMDDHFGSSSGDSAADRVQQVFRRGRAIRQLGDAVVLLPEPTYDREVLGELSDRIDRGQPVAAVAYDCFPQTHPWAFSGNGQALTSAYFRFLGRCPLTIATSAYVAEVLTSRLRRPPGATRTCWLGTDHTGVRSGDDAKPAGSLLMVGTVEPRKRVPLALHAMDLLRAGGAPAELVIIGQAGVEAPEFLRELEVRSERGDGVRWVRGAADDVVAGELRRSSVLLALGDEGFGLPAVEAAAQGCVVLYAGQQPAATLIEGRGAWRIDASTPAALAASVMPLLSEAELAKRRDAIDLSGLPTWQAFSREVVALLQQLPRTTTR